MIRDIQAEIHPNVNCDVTEGVPTSLRVARAIDRLNTALAEEYGDEYAYTIHGRGLMLAANTMRDGFIAPTVRPRDYFDASG